MNFKQWQEFSQRISARAKVAQDMRHNRGWALAETVDIPRDGCCLHNAAIDDDMTGWCFRNPQRLKIAKRANHILNDWRISHLADRIINRAWNTVDR